MGLRAFLAPTALRCRSRKVLSDRIRCFAASIACGVAITVAGHAFAHGPNVQASRDFGGAQLGQQGRMFHVTGLSQRVERDQVHRTFLGWQGVTGVAVLFACVARSVRTKGVRNSLHIRRFIVATRACPGVSRGLTSMCSMPTFDEAQHFTAAPVIHYPAKAVDLASATVACPWFQLQSELAPESFTPQSGFGLDSRRAARLVGGARRVNRTAHKGGVAAKQRTARRCIGARLQHAACLGVLAAPYDPSRLRKQIQLGLRNLSHSGSHRAHQVANLSIAQGSIVGKGVLLLRSLVEEERSVILQTNG